MKLERVSQGPILEPSANWWENVAVFNPGATIFEDKVVLLYRAVGGDHISRFGLAISDDGVVFKRREEPIFEADAKNPDERLGIEDPRIVKIGDEYLITYTGTSVYPAKEMKNLTWQRKAPWKIRTSLTRTKDFVNFSHEELLLDFDSKDSALFPEKIAERYVLLHRIYPDIYLIYSKDLKTWEDNKKIVTLRSEAWDSERLGSGPPPFKTELGWLHFYHGVDKQNVYQLGVMVHDLFNPEEITFRSGEPILSPSKPWEKQGNFPNVIFSCGAVERKGSYIVYYGAADRVIGAAFIQKADLLDFIRTNGKY